MRHEHTPALAHLPSRSLLWHVPGRIAYVVNHSFPYSSDGYAVRTHGVAQGLTALGHSVIVFNRPGRPWDLAAPIADAFPSCVDVEGVRYLFTRSPSRSRLKAEEWCTAAASALEACFRVFKPAVVMAASNWECAKPALVAARRVGLPFCYEVRGLWELSRLAREPQWEHSEAFRRDVKMESTICTAADAVFTLNSPLRAELVRRGVPGERIHLAPNGIGALPVLPEDAAKTACRSSTRRPLVVGYIGSFGAYEGLDDLVRACAAVERAGTDLELMLVGSSETQGIAGSAPCEATKALKELAIALGFGERLVMPGRVAPSEVASYYAQIDLIVIPRRPVLVSQIVTPLKPIEAAAHGRPMLLADVPPLLEIAEESRAAVTFRAGDLHELTSAIAHLLGDATLRGKLGAAARAWVARTRSWPTVVAPIHDKVAALTLTRSVATPAA